MQKNGTQQELKSSGEEATIPNSWPRWERTERINTLIACVSLCQKAMVPNWHCPLRSASRSTNQSGEGKRADLEGQMGNIQHEHLCPLKWGLEMCDLLWKYQTAQLGEFLVRFIRD